MSDEFVCSEELGTTSDSKIIWEAEGCVGVVSVARRRCFASQGTLDIIKSVHSG